MKKLERITITEIIKDIEKELKEVDNMLKERREEIYIIQLLEEQLYKVKFKLKKIQ